MTWMLCFLAVFVTVVVLGMRPMSLWRLRRIPGPIPWPFIGNLLDILRLDATKYQLAYVHKFGSIFKVFLGAMPVIMIADPVAARKVLQQCNRHYLPSLDVGSYRELSSGGILVARDSRAKAVRKAWQPMFTSTSISRCLHAVTGPLESLVDILGDAAARGSEVDMSRLLKRFMLEAAGEMAFGVSLGVQHAEERGPGVRQWSGSHSSEASAQLLQAATTLVQDPVVGGSMWLALTLLLPSLADVFRWMALALPDQLYRRTIQARKVLQHAGQQLLHSSLSGQGGAPQGQDRFMQLLLKAQDQESGDPLFTPDQIVFHAESFLLASHETTATCMATTLYCLAAHPRKMARCEQELQLVGGVGLQGQEDALQLLSQLPYLEACIKEALRLYPPAAVAVRELKRDTVLPGGLRIPAGSAVEAAIFAIHHSERLWPQAQEFIPERFSPDAPPALAADLQAFMPFGDGPRSCLGQRLALQLAKLTLYKLISRFQFTLLPGQVPLSTSTKLTFGPWEGIRFSLQHRTGALNSTD